MASLFKILSVISLISIVPLSLYVKALEKHGSHWRFIATNWSLKVYAVTYNALLAFGLKKQSYDSSVELQIMDRMFRDYVKPSYTNHDLSSAKQLLLQTRGGRQDFLKLTLPPVWEADKAILEYDTMADIKVLWVNKRAVDNGVLVSFHGGAYVSGSAESCLPYLLPLTQYTNMSAVSVQYSLSPEVTLPRQVDEALAVYKYLLDTRKLSASKIVLVGDSAGASLLLLLIQRLIRIRSQSPESAVPLPQCAMTMSSWDVPSNADSYVNNRESDSLMDDHTGIIWGYFAVGNIDFDGNVIVHDEQEFEGNMNDNMHASYLHANNLWTYEHFPPLFMSVSQWECVLDDSVRVKNEMEKYTKGNECVLHMTKHCGIHVLEDFHAHGIAEAEELIQAEAQWILRQMHE